MSETWMDLIMIESTKSDYGLWLPNLLETLSRPLWSLGAQGSRQAKATSRTLPASAPCPTGSSITTSSGMTHSPVGLMSLTSIGESPLIDR